MESNNAKKREQLGMPLGTATAKLRKSILFKFVQLQGLDNCFQCGDKINSVDDLSIEHKEPWLNSEDPVGKFFDLKNIAFSHLACNVKESTRSKNSGMKINSPVGYSWCTGCKKHKPISEFHKCKSYWRGLANRCKTCKEKGRKKYREKKRAKGLPYH